MPRTDTRPQLALGTFAGALVVLLANDWLFKGHGILPNWLTGKLSDFAGLIVAPVSLASLLTARRRLTQLHCIAAVSASFVLTEVSPASAAWFEDLLARLGLVWRLWPDPTDLVALAVLPITWFCCRGLAEGAGPGSSAGRAARWLALPACAACLASGETGPATFSAPAYVYNGSASPAFVEISNAWLDCDALSDFDHDFLDLDDFVTRGSFEVAAGAVLPLDPSDLGDRSRLFDWNGCLCPLFRVSAAGHTVNVHIQEPHWVNLVQTPSANELKPYRGKLVVLHAEPEPIEVGAELGTFALAPPRARADDTGCASSRGPSLDVSFPPLSDIQRNGPNAAANLDDVPILAVTPIAGNCFELELGAPGGAVPETAAAASPTAADAGTDAGESLPPEPRAHARIHLCAPLELFSFQSGDRVDFEWSQLDTSFESLEISNGGTHFRLARGVYSSRQHPTNWPNYTATPPSIRCGPLRDARGTLFEPIDVAYGEQALLPGQAVRVAGNHQIYLGRAERQLGRACGTDDSFVEVVETWGY